MKPTSFRLHSLVRTGLAAAVTCAAGCLPGTDGAPPTEASLRSQVARYDSVWAQKDVGAVRDLLSPDYLYFTSRGGLRDLQSILDLVSDTTYALTRSERSEVVVAIVGTVGRVSSRWQGEGTYQGSVVLDDQTCGMTWHWERARWVLFTEFCVNRPPAESTPAGSGA